jgi:N-acetyl-anhydromuramyl-L-alanine amidase AmpD
LVREKDRAWHARCWNKAAIGIEHEGFAKNPEFLTPEMYQASADLVSHLSAQYSIPATDRYIVGHNFWSTPGFEQSPIAEIGKCNDHDDPGQFWSWNLFLSLIRR